MGETDPPQRSVVLAGASAAPYTVPRARLPQTDGATQMSLPFTHDQFLDLFGEYNRALWPAAVLLWLATLGALVMLYRGRPGASRVLAALLAVHWAWAGAVYHLAYFRRINPAAMLFGIVFLVEAGLLVWRGVLRADVHFTLSPRIWSRVGIGLILYALAYPVLGLLSGLRYPRLPTFGVPCPTTILTAGVLLLLSRRDARLLGWIPVLWAGVGGSAAFVLGIRADLALPLAAILILCYMFLPASPTGATAAAGQTR